MEWHVEMTLRPIDVKKGGQRTGTYQLVWAGGLNMTTKSWRDQCGRLVTVQGHAVVLVGF